jgi:hypothetical protein
MLLVFFSLAACQLFTGDSRINGDHQLTPAAAESTRSYRPSAGDHWSVYHNTEISLKIKVPSGWETFHTDAGIVLTERVGSVSSSVILEGILVHVFIPTTDEFTFPESDDVNVAWAILSQVVAMPEYVGSALVSDPVAFNWDHHDAAYYLLNNRNNTVTLLLALGLPGHNLVVCHISSPVEQADRIRPLLPQLLESLTVNDQPIDATALHHLPDPLVFPVDDRHDPPLE